MLNPVNKTKFVLFLWLCIPQLSCANQIRQSSELFLNPTIYYNPTIDVDITKCETKDMVPMISPEGSVLVELCKSDFDECLMQGSCFVVKNSIKKSYSYYARGSDSIPRFTEVDLNKCPYGFGINNNCLDPNFSVAADLKIYKLGSVIFIPRVVGIKMSNGEVHDGFFIVRDSGAMIKGPARFDFFTGFLDHHHKENILAQFGFDDRSNSFEFRIATDPEAELTRSQRFYPGVREIKSRR
jgi:3D (Asp-Asp-Asp) domain-containing protein